MITFPLFFAICLTVVPGIFPTYGNVQKVMQFFSLAITAASFISESTLWKDTRYGIYISLMFLPGCVKSDRRATEC